MLVEAKLSALVARQWGPAERRRESFARGAALIGEAGEGAGRAAWVYLEDQPARGLGPALLWAERYGVEAPGDVLRLLADDDTRLLARRAALFVEPGIEVWRIDGTELSRMDAGGGDEAPAGQRAEGPGRSAATGGSPGPGSSAPALAEMLVEAGVQVVVEGGVVRGEVNGLEVARIVEGESTAGVPLDEPLLEVGVGAADRELTALVHGRLPPRERLARVVEIVRSHRRAGAERHPLNQLVPERWLRAVLCRHPDAIGLADLRPAEPARPRPNLRDPGVAVARGTSTAAGQPVVVACSVGIDLDAVPAAADSREAIDPSAELWLVVPERDDHPGTRRLASRLRRPAQVVTVDDDWRSLDGADS